jgi:putative ABC transport system permease protein
MISNYLKIAWRNLTRNKAFSAINISGLALGMACSLLIMLWIQDEKSIDAFHANNDQLYQVYERSFYDGKVEAGYPTQGLLADELKKVIPDIQYASGFEYAAAPGTQNNFESSEKTGKMTGFFVGEDFLKMFSYPLLHGQASTALSQTNSIALSKRMANYFFGSDQQAVGKVIRFENKEDLIVTAVFDDIPRNSSQRFDFLRSWVDFVKQNKWVNNWGNTSPATFVQLRAGATGASVETKIRDFIYRYQPKSEGFRMELALQPYSERYLHSSFKNGQLSGGRIEYVRIFTVVAIFILLIACINFMNLATAQSARRAKEVGLRKVVGARRNSLISQFIGEAMMLTLFSVALALLIVAMLLPAFNSLTGKALSIPFHQPLFWASLVALIVITGFVSGSYPALFLSALNPVRVLKGTLKFAPRAVVMRKGLVVFQFALSIMLITGMIVIYKQMDYVQNANLGYDRENLIYIPIEGELVNRYDLFKKEALASPGILNISKMRNSPTVIEHHTGSISWPGKDQNLTISFADAVVGYDFVKTMNLQMKEGRDFSTSFGTDSASYMLNETAAARMGFTNAIGQTVHWGNRPGKIIGVLKDFHFNSMHATIDPLIIRLDEKWTWGTILVRSKAGDTKNAIASLEKIYKQINPKFPFSYQFSDQEYARLYKSEQVVSKLSNYFAFLAIFISCLGLFGLATFTAHQRTKEIGVRKVLGASAPNIVKLLSTDFLKPIILSIIISVPAASYFVNQWLQNFAYKITVEWWVYALAGIITMVIALLTVSYQSVSSALRNPVKSLRTE